MQQDPGREGKSRWRSWGEEGIKEVTRGREPRIGTGAEEDEGGRRLGDHHVDHGEGADS